MRLHKGYWRVSAIALVIAFLAVACGSGGSKSEQSPGGQQTKGKLIVVNPGGSYAAAVNAAYLQPFENETGIKIEQVEGGDNPIAAVQAQVKSGNVQWDLVSCLVSSTLENPDVWEPVDTSIVKPSNLLYPEEVGKLYVINEIQAFPVLAYSKKAFKGTAPASWADFFDVQKFPGPRGVFNLGLDSAWRIPALALLADGVAPENLFPLNLDRAYAKLDQLKPHIRVFWTSFSQSQDILRSGEVAMNLMTDGRALQLLNSGQEIGVSWDGAFRSTAPWCVPKGAPDAKNAWQFLQYILSHPKQEAVFTSLTYYGPPTKDGVTQAKSLGLSDFSSLHTDKLIPDDVALYQYVAKNSDALLKRWNAWVGA